MQAREREIITTISKQVKAAHGLWWGKEIDGKCQKKKKEKRLDISSVAVTKILGYFDHVKAKERVFN
jgi:hypothetical protein